MTPFIITEEIEQQLTKLFHYAHEHPITWEHTQKCIQSGEPLAAADSHFYLLLPFGFSVAFTVEETQRTDTKELIWVRHLSVSLNRQGRVPNPFVVEMLAKAFKLGELKECMAVYIEDMSGSNKAVNVVSQFTPEPVNRG